MSEPAEFSPMQRLKRALYAMRNGIVADTLRRGGCPYRLIFGVNLPQLTEIASQFGPSAPLAAELAADTSLRESALLSFMLLPVDTLTIDDARRLVARVRWSEDADILCFKLLRHTPFAATLAAELSLSEAPLDRYTALRLYFSLLADHAPQALEAARREAARPDAIAGLAGMLEQEALFFIGDD